MPPTKSGFGICATSNAPTGTSPESFRPAAGDTPGGTALLGLRVDSRPVASLRLSRRPADPRNFLRRHETLCRLSHHPQDADRLVSHGLGDWCPYRKMPSVQVTTSSYYYVDAKITAETAKMLGKTEDAEKYAALADRIRADYCRVLIDGATGQCDDGSLTAQSCPIHQGLVDALPEKEQKAVFDRLLDRLHAVDAHFDCGIFGAKYILRTLSEGGRTDLALRMVLQETSPCYADWIRRGAGTLWEDWGEGSSRNHVMFGDVSAWFYQYLAGIRLDGAPYPRRWGSVGAGVPSIDLRRTVAERLAVPGKEPLRSVDAHLDTLTAGSFAMGSGSSDRGTDIRSRGPI